MGLIEDFALAVPPLIAEPAVYILELFIPDEIVIDVGKKGPVRFEGGSYLYVGSAKRGLRSRASRHLFVSERRRWHIDHIVACSSERRIWWTPYTEGGECGAAHRLSFEHEGIPGIGCSDCRCHTHLFRS
ncbi:MAG: GIY-YIG nuclease family protein [Candidatus Thermoplasmatota archaeon]|nr:GIY-YIG nuclease family protein [Candidatus Thermoplasmatota archaeon]